MRALSLHITGVVQGVGFRPFVYNLARSLDLAGWVRNTSEGVFCVVEGTDEALDAFVRDIREKAPPMAVVDEVFAEDVEAQGFAAFVIEESHAEPGAMTLVSPDIATCPECLRELDDPADRRGGYPFINCTNCGPRFTIIDDIPYDRPMTTMRDFPMCPECAAEYGDPADRRFHAQPDACFVCGPRLYLNAAGVDPDFAWSPEREPAPRPHRERESERARSHAIVDGTARILRGGGIVAVKGLGGFQLACDATNEKAVARLRERKRRWGKPLAVMVADIETARGICDVDDVEAELLAGTARPIVLLRRRGVAGETADGGSAASSAGGGGGVDDVSSAPSRAPAEDCLSAGPPSAGRTPATDALAPSVAPGLREVGLMLPYTPLHHLFVRAAGVPLVMTSGNLSDEPIATGNAEALARLSGIADAFLMHDRGIRSRYDDSVVCVVRGRFESVRRARGYAPYPMRLPHPSDAHVLAVGPEQKNTFTLVREDLAFVSQHIGDMENAETMEGFEDTIALYERLFRIEPELVAHDLHPEYLSTKYAMSLDLPKLGVQHHHAHIAGVTAEHGVADRVIGIALDGTGYGDDGHIWGGEVLLADWCGYKRFAHLREVPMPGGAGAVRRPARMAIGTLAALGFLEHPGAAPLRSRLAEGEEDLLLRMVERGVNSPPTSSMGRLFDAVAAISGVRDDALYEGQAAIELEACADPAETGAYAFDLIAGEPLVIDPVPVIEALLDDMARGVQAPVVSARFHRAVVDAIVAVASAAADRTGIRTVAVAGGVFMNRLVLGGTMESLANEGFAPLTHLSLPLNDAAVSYGQAVVACARRRGYKDGTLESLGGPGACV